MLQIARLSPRELGDAAPLVAAFLRSQQNPDGGFRSRSGESDLYYTVFGLEGLIALGEPVPASTAAYLRTFGDGDGLDLTHLCCLVRSWANVIGRHEPFPMSAEKIAARLEAQRSPDGGYRTTAATSPTGTAYGCFLAQNAYQDLHLPMPNPEGVVRCLEGLAATTGGYSNQPGSPVGLTPPTAAAVSLYRQLGLDPPPGLGMWLLSRCHAEGGFFATPVAPIPDLLSTATALHALAGLKTPLATELREACLDFIDSLWVNHGAFYGNWTDDAADCEYTYYGLLALGHLTL